MSSPYEIVPCHGIIPYGKLKYLHNLQILALDLTEKDIFNFRFKEEEPPPKYTHSKRYDVPLSKIGFISRDFSENRPSGQLAGEFFSFIKELAAKHSIEVYLYSFLKKTMRSFRSYGIIRESNNLFRLADMIYEDKIDILIDMQGHMQNNFNRILELKPAPIIIHWLGYPGTLGLKCIDYHIADKVILPLESTQYYREKIAYLDHCYQINNSKLLVKTSKFTRQELGYPEDKFIFCNFNDDYKLNKEIWRVWLEILKQVPNSILLCHTNSDKIRNLLLDTAREYNIEPNRIIKPKLLNRLSHINRLALVDCGLDTNYCNGHTTSSDLIAAGIPVITHPGNTYHSRVTKSILLALDMPELICASWDEYIKKAVELATNPLYNMQLKAKILDNRHKILYNSYMYTENYIKLLLNIWQNHYGVALPDNIEKMEITKFGHNKKDQRYKWIFYSRKDSPGGNTKNVELKYQELRDYADNHPDCIAFNTHGDIKKSVVSFDNLVEFGSNDNDGVWIKEYI